MIEHSIKSVIESLDTNGVDHERREILRPMVDFILSKANENKAILLNFICIHNSRRSHLSQVWAQTLAYYFDIKNVRCYSGGTESTALFPVVAKTLKKSGFDVQALSSGDNPVYSIKFAENEHPIIGFSKRFDDDFNPRSGFAAIMTCSQADVGCPFIAGAEKRLPIPFEDPKAFDGTPQQYEKYQERSLQIATELFYIFSRVKVLRDASSKNAGCNRGTQKS